MRRFLFFSSRFLKLACQAFTHVKLRLLLRLLLFCLLLLLFYIFFYIFTSGLVEAVLFTRHLIACANAEHRRPSLWCWVRRYLSSSNTAAGLLRSACTKIFEGRLVLGIALTRELLVQTSCRTLLLHVIYRIAVDRIGFPFFPVNLDDVAIHHHIITTVIEG